MSEIGAKSTVTVDVNSVEAVNKLEELRQKAVRLRDAIAQAGEAGNKAEQKNLRKQLKETTAQIRQMQSATAEVEDVMNRLDEAAPRELRRTLTKLKKELNDMERGSEAWDAQTAKIRQVRAELDKVNAAMKKHESAGQLLMSRATQWWAIGQSLIASYSGLTSSINRAVQAYADMDSEMANTQKFTGMTRKNVERLNEEFKQMDTRTSREALNQLAQSAGRLGKSSVEDVMGFVRAGDVLKVAMDELGDDAPQIISQLAGIFNLEQEMGTEQAMLAVGSAINSLSQNCAAGAPNLVEFASRLGAIGSQTGMTMDEMLAFGAVLDANRVSMEVSATSIQTVLSRMMADPADFARKAGLSVDEFTAAIERSSTEGLMVFIERLSELDKMDIAKILADLKVQDSGVIRTFNTLAGKIGEVRNQMEASKTAFDEATSAQEEFNVQNNTVQASLDKAKKKLHELATELGKQLLPVAERFLQLGIELSPVLNTVVGFIVKYGAEIVMLTGAVIAYTTGVKLAAVAMKIFNGTLKANPLGLVLSALALVIGAFVKLKTQTDAVSKAFSDFQTQLAKEQKQIDSLFGTLETARKGTKEYESAKKQIIDQYGPYLKGLIDERGELTNLEAAYNRVTTAARESAKARALDNARTKAYDDYSGKMSDLSADLEKALSSDRFGLSGKDVQALKTRIVQSIMETGDVPDDVKERFYYQVKDDTKYTKKGEYYLPAGNLGRALRNMMEAYGTLQENLQEAETVFGSKVVGSEAFSGMSDAELEHNKRLLEKMIGVLESGKSSVSGTFKNRGEEVQVKSQSIDELILSLQNYNRETARREAEKKAGTSVGQEAFAGMSDADLEYNVGKLEEMKKALESGEAYAVGYLKNYGKEVRVVSGDIEGLTHSIANYRQEEKRRADEVGTENPAGTVFSGNTGGGSPDFSAEQRWYDEEVAKAKIAYATGESDYRDYRMKLAEIDAEFAEKKLNRDDLDPVERKKLEAEQAESYRKMHSEAEATAKETADERHARNLQALKERYADEQISDESYREQKFREEIRYLEDLKRVYELNAEERAKIETQIQEREHDEKLRKQEAYRNRVKRMEDEFFGLSQQEKDEAFQTESEALAEAYNRQLQLAEGNAEEKLRVEEAYQIALKAIRKKYSQDGADGETGGNPGWLQQLDDWINGEKGEQVIKGISAVSNAMSGMFSAYSSMVQAETDIQLAAIEKRYESELAAAEGNTYKTKQIEARKEKEMAKVKSQASKKTYAMQVIQATAQIAQNIISAVGAGMQFGLAAPVMVPLLVGIATAAGAVQLAALKKQQQAAAAQGYSQGGFTRPGRADEPAGIVHAGEWVASQRLLADPVARPMIDALDYAQRTNTLGSLRMADVRTVRPAYAAERPTQAPAVSVPDSARQDEAAQTNLMLLGVINRLNRRLDEPFVTVNTVEGDRGIKKAQEEYEKLMRNKSPKSRR